MPGPVLNTSWTVILTEQKRKWECISVNACLVLLQVTRLVTDGTRNQTQAVWLQSLGPLTTTLPPL